MRINLARPNQEIRGKLVSFYVKEFAAEYEVINVTTVLQYISRGKQGLCAFVNFLCKQGFAAEMYVLEPNCDLFINLDGPYNSTSQTSPSFGFIIPDDDEKLVEFKLAHL